MEQWEIDSEKKEVRDVRTYVSDDRGGELTVCGDLPSDEQQRQDRGEESCR